MNTTNFFCASLVRVALVAALLTGSFAAEAATTRTTKVVIPQGTRIALQIQDTLSSETNHKGDAFSLKVSEAVTVDGKRVLPAGAKVDGKVILAMASGRLARQGRLGIDLGTVMVNGEAVEIRAVHGVGDSKQPKARRILSRIASPVVRIGRAASVLARRDILGEDVTQVVNTQDGEVREIANRAVGFDDPLASVELGKSSTGARIATRSLNALERVGTGYIQTVVGGPIGLLKKGAYVMVPAGTTVYAEVVKETTVTIRR